MSALSNKERVMLAAQFAAAHIHSGRSWTTPAALIESSLEYVRQIEAAVEAEYPRLPDGTVLEFPKKLGGR